MEGADFRTSVRLNRSGWRMLGRDRGAAPRGFRFGPRSWYVPPRVNASAIVLAQCPGRGRA